MFFENKMLKRRLSNFLLQPSLQTRMGAYCIVLSFLFSILIALIVYFHLGKLFQFIIELTEAPEEVQTIILSYLSSIQTWVYLSLCAYVVLILLISVLFTHKMVGPTVAFRRHCEALQEGDFQFRTNLRKGDAFVEIAELLNATSERLGQRWQGSEEKPSSSTAPRSEIDRLV